MIGRCDECGGCNADRWPCSSRCTCPSSIREAARDAFQAGQQRAGFGVTAAGGSHRARRVPSTLGEQVSALAPHVATAVLEHGESSDAHELAISRLIDGHAEHGTSLFTMSDRELERNLAEEYADAIVYRAEQLRREAQAVA